MKNIQYLLLIFLCSTFCSTAAEGIAAQKRFGKVIAVTGKATATKADGTIAEVHLGDEFPAGTVIKTAADGSVDLFFRRIGTMFQIQTNTSVTLDKLEMEMKGGKLLKRTELSLKEGSLLGCVRVLIPESKVLIRTPKTSFHVPGTGMGRFEFWADGSVLVGRRSKLSVVADISGEPTAVSPGQYFSAKATNVVAANPSLWEGFSKKMDALQATAIQLTPPPTPEELP